jgi:RNA polymerase sigma-70 factor (ECF subfamily)
MNDPSQRAVERAFRDEWGGIVATLIRRTGDWDLAEDCASEAFAEALRVWPRDGVPRRPGAWLTTVARNRAVDRLRRLRRGTELLDEVGRDPLRREGVEMDDCEREDERGIEDDRLRLIFTCCHPSLAIEARVALTLRTLAGLTTTEIARAFLVEEAAMAKRLTRAKAKIAGAGIPYRVPSERLLPERLAAVLAVLYLMFNEGYAASSGDDLVRADLCAEAIRLTELLVELMPSEPEAAGLLALMLLQHSRRDARVGASGELITLERQDRGAWDRAEIDRGVSILETALYRGRAGPYQLQAAIAACHASAADAESTDWPQIAGLYELLAVAQPSPVVSLNRAVAIAMAGDLDRGLALVTELADAGELSGYHLLDATRADLLRRRGDLARAAAAYELALAQAPSEPERRYLAQRLQEVSAGQG